MRFVWVGVGGAIGSVIRYSIGLTARQSLFPWATLAINLSGSFILGVFMTWALGRLSIAITTPVTVGVLGGFTTFSTFAWEGLFLSRSGRAELALVYIVLSVVGGLVAAWWGYVLGRSI
jgi:fluoride exporter